MEKKDLENKIKELQDQLKQKLMERGEEISEHGQHDNAVADSIDMEIYILKDRITRFKKQLAENNGKGK